MTPPTTYSAVPDMPWRPMTWAAAALVLGCATAMVGAPVFYAVLAVAVMVIFATLATRFPLPVMIASICGLVLCPFSLGLTTGVLPKLFADEVLLLLYLVLMLPMYLATRRRWVTGFGPYLWLLFGLILCQAAALAVKTDLIAFRNLLETYVVGPLLLVVFLQEFANNDGEEGFAKTIVWLTMAVAILSLVEKVTQRNPILEHMQVAENFQYLSPRIAIITEGTYRPYATFFHPSETGTFMAMGLPFAVRAFTGRRGLLPFLQLFVIVIGLGVNATRGVWVAAALSLLLVTKKPLKKVLYATPAVGLTGGAAYLLLKSTAFMQRVSDANNMMGRLIYWRLGIDVFSDHAFLGAGHMQFQKLYLSYVHGVNQFVLLDMKQVQVIDNVYLTQLAEHGLVGLLSLLALFVCTLLYLHGLRGSLLKAGLTKQASLLQAVTAAILVYAVSGVFADVNQFTKVTKLLFIFIGFGVGSAVRVLRKQPPAEAIQRGMPEIRARFLQEAVPCQGR